VNSAWLIDAGRGCCIGIKYPQFTHGRNQHYYVTTYLGDDAIRFETKQDAFQFLDFLKGEDEHLVFMRTYQ
jgi:hypothetical protein